MNVVLPVGQVAAPHPAKRASLKRQHGYNMVEIGLGLVIVTLLGVGVITYFAGNSSAAQANQLAADMTTLMGKVKASYGGQYGTVTNAKLDTGGFFKSLPALKNNAGVVSTDLGGGTLTVASGTVTVAGDSVMYTVTKVPDSACLPLVTALVKSATGLKVGANVVKAAGGVADPSKITCSGDATTVEVTVQ